MDKVHLWELGGYENLSTCSSSVALMWINPFCKKESCRFLKILLMVNLNCVNLLKVTNSKVTTLSQFKQKCSLLHMRQLSFIFLKQ